MALSEDMDIVNVVYFANAIATLSITRMDAQEYYLEGVRLRILLNVMA